MAGILRQSVQALARLYLARHGAAGEEEAQLLLRNYWFENPREEDVLRQLMELLGRRECYHEALEYYEQLQKLLETDHCRPDAQTQDVAAYLRAKQIQRRPIQPSPLQQPPLPIPVWESAFVSRNKQQIILTPLDAGEPGSGHSRRQV